MPAWIHNRAEHLLAKNPKMDKSQAFAIATQQSHKLGKSPKGYGTPEGKAEARKKYDKPRKEYIKGANPGDLSSSKIAAALTLFFDKIARVTSSPYMLDQVGKPKLKSRLAGPPNETFQVKQAFAVSQYSGTLGPGKFNFYASSIPGFKVDDIKKKPGTVKQAADNKKKPGLAESNNRALRGMATTVGGLGAALAGGHVVQNANSMHDANDAELVRKLIGSASVPVVPAGKATAHSGFAEMLGKINPAAGREMQKQINQSLESVLSNNAAFIAKDQNKKPLVAIGRGMENSPSIVAHELGHANIHSNKAGRLLQNNATRVAGSLSASMLAGGLSGALTADSDDSRVQALGRWAPAIIGAPRLAYEGGASALGLLNMRRHGANKNQIKQGLKTLVPAFGTYAGTTAMGLGAAHAAQGLAQRDNAISSVINKKKKKRETEGSQNKEANLQSPQSQITRSQKVGAPKVSPSPGPSIQQVSKPIGYGTPDPGKTKPGVI